MFLSLGGGLMDLVTLKGLRRKGEDCWRMIK